MSDRHPLFRHLTPERRWNVLTYDLEIHSYTLEAVNVNWEQLKATLRGLRAVGYNGAYDPDVIVERIEATETDQ